MSKNADVGHRLENLVFLELNKRYDGRVWIGKNYEKEIYFVAKRPNEILDYYQVAESAADISTFEREVKALKNTGDTYSKTLLALDIPRPFHHQPHRI